MTFAKEVFRTSQRPWISLQNKRAYRYKEAGTSEKIGGVDIPQEAFLAMPEVNEN